MISCHGEGRNHATTTGMKRIPTALARAKPCTLLAAKAPMKRVVVARDMPNGELNRNLYWPLKVFWLFDAGASSAWAYAVVGVAYQSLLLWLLARRFARVIRS